MYGMQKQTEMQRRARIRSAKTQQQPPMNQKRRPPSMKAESKIRKKQKSDADGAAHRAIRLLCAAHHQPQAGAALLALADQRLVAPDAAADVAAGQHEALVAARVPPAADAVHHLSDALVAVLRLVAQQVAEVGHVGGRALVVEVRDVGVGVGRRGAVAGEAVVARGRDGAGGRHAHEAALQVLEAAPPQ